MRKIFLLCFQLVAITTYAQLFSYGTYDTYFIYFNPTTIKENHIRKICFKEERIYPSYDKAPNIKTTYLFNQQGFADTIIFHPVSKKDEVVINNVHEAGSGEILINDSSAYNRFTNDLVVLYDSSYRKVYEKNISRPMHHHSYEDFASISITRYQYDEKNRLIKILTKTSIGTISDTSIVHEINDTQLFYSKDKLVSVIKTEELTKEPSNNNCMVTLYEYKKEILNKILVYECATLELHAKITVRINCR